MSSTETRDVILGRIRGSLGAHAADAVRRKSAHDRLKAHRPNLIPKRAQMERDSRLDLFTRMLEGQSAKVSQAKTPSEVPEIIATYLREHNLPAEFRSGSDPLLADIPWDKAPSLSCKSGRGQGSDAVTVSRAQAAAAETGTLFLTSGVENPTTLNFLPDNHIVVIRAEDILGSYEDAWNALRQIYGEGVLPRTVNLISGASRTADIEQIIVMGAHGPRNLHVIVLG